MAGLSLSSALSLSMAPRFGGSSAPAGMPFPSVTSTPTVRLHAGQSTITESGGRATSVTDVQGLANAVNTTGVGPLVGEDGNGWPFLQFNGAEYMSGGTGFVADTKNVTVIMVMRSHRSKAFPILSLGNVEAGTGASTSNALVRQFTLSQSAAYLASSRAGIPAYGSNRAYMLPGCELQVIAVRSDMATVRTLVNNIAANSTANSIVATGVQGYEVARNANGNAPGASGTWGTFDLYDMLLYNTGLSDAATDAAVAELVAGYGIVPKTNRFVGDGDSITFGLRALSGNTYTMLMTRPGDAIVIDDTWSVLNVGVSSNPISAMVTRRDDANTVYAEKLPGRNVISLHAGTNNMDSPLLQTGATAYAALVPLIYTTTTGYLQRGWEVFVDKIIGYDNSGVQAEIAAYRALVGAAQFLTDTDSAPGGTYAGKVTVVDVAGYQFGGGTLFDTQANAQNINAYGRNVYFDGVHPVDLGNYFLAAAKRDAIFGAVTPVPPF